MPQRTCDRGIPKPDPSGDRPKAQATGGFSQRSSRIFCLIEEDRPRQSILFSGQCRSIDPFATAIRSLMIRKPPFRFRDRHGWPATFLPAERDAAGRAQSTYLPGKANHAIRRAERAMFDRIRRQFMQDKGDAGGCRDRQSDVGTGKGEPLRLVERVGRQDSSGNLIKMQAVIFNPS